MISSLSNPSEPLFLEINFACDPQRAVKFPFKVKLKILVLLYK